MNSRNVHQQAGLGVEYIMKNALLRRTLDNVTVVIIAFQNFQNALLKSQDLSLSIQSTSKQSIDMMSRTGFQTPGATTSNILEKKDLKHLQEEHKVPQRTKKTDLSSHDEYSRSVIENEPSVISNKKLVSPHTIGGKSISTKNEEISTKVKHFDFSVQAVQKKFSGK